MNGKNDNDGGRDYVIVDFSKTDPLRDIIYFCWNQDGYRWKVVNQQVSLVDKRIDTTKYYFSTKLPENHLGIPEMAEYSYENCVTFDFYTNELVGNGVAVILQ